MIIIYDDILVIDNGYDLIFNIQLLPVLIWYYYIMSLYIEYSYVLLS